MNPSASDLDIPVQKHTEGSGTQADSDSPWQNSVDKFASMGKHLISNREFSDVTFKVGKDGQQMEEIQGHRVILAARSSVFATMFYGSLPENKAFIEVTDTKPEHFELMLQFLYTDETSGIVANNVLDMYIVAHKYDITPLKKYCAQQVPEFISMENLEDFMDANDLYEDKLMDENVRYFIKVHGWKLFQKEEYYKDLSFKRLMFVWEQCAVVSLPEVDIFKGAITWAKFECERQGLSPEDAKNQRQVLGDALNLICFPRMSLGEFFGIATKDGILTWEERDQIALYLANVAGAVLPFGKSLPKKEVCGCNCKAALPKRCQLAEADFNSRVKLWPYNGNRNYKAGDVVINSEGTVYRKTQAGKGSDADWVTVNIPRR